MKHVSVTKKNGCLSADGILKYLENKREILYFNVIDSTNTALKKMAQEGAKEGTVLVTQMQTAGKGRLGKSFFSPKGCGIYFSILLRPKVAPADACFITVGAAVAIRRALLSLLKLETQTKWVNDIYHNGKKLCGILTESAADTKENALCFAVLGIGINLETPEEGYPREFAYKTTNLKEAYGNNLPKDFENRLVAEILTQFDAIYAHLEEKEYLEEYKKSSCMLGKKITILSGPCAGDAIAEDIDDNANLVVRLPDGTLKTLFSGDVSIGVFAENLLSNGNR